MGVVIIEAAEHLEENVIDRIQQRILNRTGLIAVILTGGAKVVNADGKFGVCEEVTGEYAYSAFAETKDELLDILKAIEQVPMPLMGTGGNLADVADFRETFNKGVIDPQEIKDEMRKAAFEGVDETWLSIKRREIASMTPEQRRELMFGHKLVEDVIRNEMVTRIKESQGPDPVIHGTGEKIDRGVIEHPTSSEVFPARGSKREFVFANEKRHEVGDRTEITRETIINGRPAW